MGAYIPGMEEHNAINNDDGFSTGFIGKQSPFSSGSNQGFNPGPQQQPQIQQPMPQQMTQPISMQSKQPVKQPKLVQQPMPQHMTQPIPQQPMMNNNKPFGNKPMNVNNSKVNMPNTKGMLKNTGAQIQIDQEKTSNVIGIISLVILVALIIFVVLLISGKIGGKKNETTEEKDPEVVNTKTPEEEENERMITKLTMSCQNLDEIGNFGAPVDSEENTCESLTCFIYENVICTNYLCMVANKENVYSKDCNSGEIRKANKTNFQATLNLNEICELIIKNNAYEGTWETSYASCTNYECTTTVDGKTFNKTCQ